jgi:uncharacterized membrane protein (DUF4010 family)
MSPDSLLARLAIALAIGLLIGLERGWQAREEEEGQRTAGLRTYTLSALLGGVCAAVAGHTATLFLGFAFVTFGGAFTAFHWLEARAEKTFSVTGVVAGLLAFALGAYAVLGEVQVAIAAAVATTLFLALKKPLHSWLRRLTWAEMRAVLTLLTMTFLALPWLPNRAIDPWGAINPSEIWILAIIIAGLSFAGYAAVRALGGQAGITLAALAGGLASSTATTLTLARFARSHAGASRLLAGGILLSGAVMVVRVIIVASAINESLLLPLGAALGAAGTVLVAGGTLLVTRANAEQDRPALEIKNPFELATALKLAGLIALISLAARVLEDYVGREGLMVLAVISGTVDVDAVTLSFARLAHGEIGHLTALACILLAVASNTASKTLMTFAVGTRQVGWLVAGVSLAAAVAAVLAFWVVSGA